MKHRLLNTCIGLLSLLATPALAMAEEPEILDVRLEGFPQRVTLESDSTGLIWLLLIVLATIGLGVLFKNARRTHLD